MSNEPKPQNHVVNVLYAMRNYPIPKHQHDRQLAVLWANQFEEAWNREKAEMAAKAEASMNAVSKSDRNGPSVDDIRCCCLDDIGYMKEQADAVYPEVFFSGQIDVSGLSKALRALAKAPFVPLTPGARYLIVQGSFTLAKQCGWKMPDQPPELDLEPPNEKGEVR